MANARLSPSPSGRGRGRGREERGGVLYLSPPTSQWPSVNSKPTTYVHARLQTDRPHRLMRIIRTLGLAVR